MRPLAALALGILAIAVGCGGAGAESPETVVREWSDALNAGDNDRAADLFARYCDRAARRLAANMGAAVTLNEPNMITVVGEVLPPQMTGMVRDMNAAAGRAWR